MIRKSRVLIYFEFFQNQNPEEIENSLRHLASNNQFPPFRNIMVGIDHKNLKTTEKEKSVPIVIGKEE